MSRLLTEAEAAELLRLRPATLRRWRWARKNLPYVKIGGAVRYREIDLLPLAGTAGLRGDGDSR
jgi:hypothetical protein